MKTKRISNYVPHNNFYHREITSKDMEDKYLENLCKTVNKACDRFFDRKKMVRNHQFVNSVMFNKTQEGKK